MKEIRKEMLNRGVCTQENLPSEATVLNIIRNDLGMTRKIIQQIPIEATTDRHDTLFTNFLSEILLYRPEQIHFFDECSIVGTAGNRRYGHSVRGERAVEVKRYATNAKFT